MKRSKNPRGRIQSLIEKAKAQSSENSPDALNTWTRATFLSLQLVSPDFGLTQYCINNVGKSLVDQGDYERAIGVLEPALEKARETVGLAHPLVEHPCQSLGRAYDALGDYAKSQKYWDAAACSAESTRGIYHASTIFCLSKKARALRSQGLHEEALTAYCKVWGRTQFAFGNDLRTAFAARELAACYCQLGRFEEAIPIWQHAKHCFDEHPRYHKYARNMKRCLSWSRNQAWQSRHACSNAGRTDEVVSSLLACEN
ncbi:MAG: tetratricopeptide repeat protein [Candidatus Obscuribacterales bacterium]|nr:tetratricopeptide repeat protein [Candidatus Obscuribacterales bacterium]